MVLGTCALSPGPEVRLSSTYLETMGFDLTPSKRPSIGLEGKDDANWVFGSGLGAEYSYLRNATPTAAQAGSVGRDPGEQSTCPSSLPEFHCLSSC